MILQYFISSKEATKIINNSVIYLKFKSLFIIKFIYGYLKKD